ncbi:unnamed protein product [Parajaminaea phylloscopi]
MKLTANAVCLSLLLGLCARAMPTRGPRVSIPEQQNKASAGNLTCTSDASSSSTQRGRGSSVTITIGTNATAPVTNSTTTFNGPGFGGPAPGGGENATQTQVSGDKAGELGIVVVVKNDGKETSITASMEDTAGHVNVTGRPSDQSLQDSPASGAGARPRCAVAHINATQQAKLERENRALISQRRIHITSLKGANSHIKVVETNMSTVPVYWHVITDGCKGYLDDGDLAGQMETLNADYKPHGFSFELRNVSYTDRPEWFSQAYDTKAANDMKRSLRRGDGAKALNIYSVNFQDGTLGYATFPWDYKNNPEIDGVVMQFNTVPRGGLEHYNGGRTVTHEVGHWLGLLHTFEGGCAAPGDYVDDTPPSASPTSGCPPKRDSCTGDDLDDPIHNYMDYSYDSCMNSFTDGQTARMQALTSRYRGL